jgi:hypothetical protein
MKLLGVFLSLILASVPALALKTTFEQIEESGNLSQLLRANAPHYWDYASKKSNVKDLAPYLEETGVISGDAHIGNFGVIPAADNAGQTSLRFLNIDFDDGGTGPFALEFARFVAVAKASSKDIKMNDLTQAYLAGLQGRKVPVPTSIENALNFGMPQYEKFRRDYVQKKVQGNVFKYEAGKLEAWTGSPTKTDIMPLFRDLKVLDVAQRPLERGGSLGAVRLWILTQDASGVLRIYELKAYQDTALSRYQKQISPQVRIQGLYDLYWRGLNQKAYGIVSLVGTFFWLREKKVDLIEYESKADEDEVRIYLANQIGFFQRGQEQAQPYVAKVLKDPNAFHEAMKSFVKTYLELAKQVLK